MLHQTVVEPNLSFVAMAWIPAKDWFYACRRVIVSGFFRGVIRRATLFGDAAGHDVPWRGIFANRGTFRRGECVMAIA